jgi:UDP-glucose 4-epimerase
VGTALPVRHVDPRPGDVRHSQADATRLLALFPDVAPTDLADALRATVAWFRAEVVADAS